MTRKEQIASLKKTLGQVANKSGHEREDRVIHILQNNQSRWPTWLKSVRKATKKEDRRGCDIVAETDIGELYLQVKSSVKGIEDFKKKNRKRLIATILSKPSKTDKRILNQSLESLVVLRKIILDRRL